MKFSSAFLLASFTLLASAAPSTDPTTAEQGIKEKIAAITDREGSLVESNARAPVTATVSGDGVRYRRCPKTSCEAVGEYNKGQIITIRCLAFGESINGWNWWDRMDNGYYIFDKYVNWTGGTPDICR